MSLYRNVFSRALKITWKNKLFWFLGIFTVFFSTSVEIELFDSFLNRNSLANGWQGMLAGSLFKQGLLDVVRKLLALDSGAAAIFSRVLLLTIVVLLILLVISVLTQLVIIDRSAAIIKSDSANFKLKNKFGWQGGWQRVKTALVPSAVLSMILKIAVNMVFALITLPVLFFGPERTLTGSIVYVIVFLLLLPAAIIAAFVIRYMIAYLVIDKLPLKQAIVSGWQLFKDNWLVSAEASFMLFLINIIGSLAVVVIISALAVPLWFLAVAGKLYISAKLFYLVLGFAYFLFLAVFILGGSLLSVFNITAWTSLFIKLDKSGGDSKIVRVFSEVIKKPPFIS